MVDTATTTTVTAEVRRAHPAEHPKVCGILAAAFADDPVFAWIDPDAAHRHTFLPAVFALLTGDFERHEIHVATSDHGAAVWGVPGAAPLAPHEQAAFERALPELVGDGAARGGELMEALAAVHPHEPHAHLKFLGTVPDAQGRGLGSTMLAPMLARCDRDGLPAFLEATTVRSRALYERHGFETVAEVRVADSPSLWPMVRSPRPVR